MAPGLGLTMPTTVIAYLYRRNSLKAHIVVGCACAVGTTTGIRRGDSRRQGLAARIIVMALRSIF